MDEAEPAFRDEIERAGEHRLILGREAGDEIGAEDDIGAQGADLGAEANGVVTAVAALHALEDEVVAGLKGEMQMRHQARLGRQQVSQGVVDLDGVDRGEAQAR